MWLSLMVLGKLFYSLRYLYKREDAFHFVAERLLSHWAKSEETEQPVSLQNNIPLASLYAS